MLPYAVVLDFSSQNLSKVLLDGLAERKNDERILRIDCKYYTADASLLHMKSTADDEGPTAVKLSSAEGVIICLDPSNSDSCKNAERWQKKSSEFNIPIRLLFCEELPVDSSGTELIRVAIGNQFEVVQLHPSEESLEDGEECGLSRIRSCLEAHSWPGMKFKDKRDINSHSRKKFATEINENSSKTCNILPKTMKATGDKTLPAEKKPMDKTREDTFDNLFPQLLALKSKATNLNPKERRKLAEEVTLKFWKAIDGDEEEVDGLSDDSS